MAALAPPRSRRRWLKAWIGLMALGIVALGAFWALYVHDAPPPDDADLRTPSPTVPDAQNGFRAMAKLDDQETNFLTYADSQGVDIVEARNILMGEASNDVLVSRFIEKNKMALAQINTALAMPDFELSRTVTIENLVPEISQILNGAKILVLASRLAKLDGDYKTAAHEIYQIHMLAQRTAMAHGNIILTLTARAVDGIAVRECLLWINDPRMPPEALEGLRPAFSEGISWPVAFQFSFKIEYQFLRNLLLQIRPQPEKFVDASKISAYNLQRRLLPYMLKLNESLRDAAVYLRRCIQCAGLDYKEAKKIEQSTPPLETVTTWTLFSPNGVGKDLLNIVLPAENEVIATECEGLAEDRLAQTTYALRQYFDARHRLPAKLADLVPQYLPAVPADPFDGQPLRYDRAKGIIYSVGTLLKDNGGSKYLKMRKDDPHYEDPMEDNEQPTLQLTFQNAPKDAAAR